MASFPKVQTRDRWRRGAALAGALVATCALGLYVSTLAPTVLGFEPPEIFDSPMLQAAAYTLGIGHPTGYPTYMIWTHLFTYLPFGDPGYRTNLASAVYAAGAVGAVYAAGLLLSRRVFAAAVGAVAFAVSPTFWSQATIAEVYTLNALFVALVLSALLLWRETRRDRYLLLVAALAGLSLTHHLTSALLLPAAILFVALTDRRKLGDGRLLAGGAGLFLLGLVPYLYLPLRAAMGAPLNEADPSTPGRFLLLVTGGNFLLKNLRDAQGDGASGELSPAPILDPLLARLPDYWSFVSEQFPAVLALFGVVGIAYLFSTDRAATALLGVPLAGSLLHGLLYGFEDYFLFAIPAYLVFGLLIAVGLAALSRRLEGPGLPPALGAALATGLWAVALAAALFGAWGDYAAADRSEDYEGRREIDAVARHAGPGATVLHHRSALWYMVLVEERRHDLTLIDPFQTSFVRFRDIVWPDRIDAAEAAARYRTDDTTGVATAREAAREGPVYLLDPAGAYVRAFRDAGFDAAEVEEGTGLYELRAGER